LNARSEIAGTPFPGGLYTLDPDENRTVCEILGADPAGDGSAHPIFGFIASLVGCGAGVEDIAAAGGATVEEGPMLATFDLDFCTPLRAGETYDVAGEFTGIERKHGRRAGTFDLLTFELRVTDANGSRAVTCVQSWILPRASG
jgi:hypothetical protein